MQDERDLLNTVLYFDSQEQMICRGMMNTALLGYREVPSQDYAIGSGMVPFISRREFGGLILAQFGVRMSKRINLLAILTDLERDRIEERMVHLPIRPLPWYPTEHAPALQVIVNTSDSLPVPTITFNLIPTDLIELFEGKPTTKGEQNG